MVASRDRELFTSKEPGLGEVWRVGAFKAAQPWG
jgi:hypothetical protein